MQLMRVSAGLLWPFEVVSCVIYALACMYGLCNVCVLSVDFFLFAITNIQNISLCIDHITMKFIRLRSLILFFKKFK